MDKKHKSGNFREKKTSSGAKSLDLKNPFRFQKVKKLGHWSKTPYFDMQDTKISLLIIWSYILPLSSLCEN